MTHITTPDVLVIGDLHLKTPQIETRVKNVITSMPSINKVVFLGDLNDDWNASPEDRVHGMESFLDLHHWLKSQDVEVVTLIGNHDASYLPWVDSTSLTFRNASPGHDYDSEHEISGMLSQVPDLKMAELIHIAEVPTVLTHAGVTASWLIKNMPDKANDPQAVVDGLNQMLVNGDWNSLYVIGRARGGLHSSIPSPLWADIKELAYDPAEGFNQIVGHSPVSTVTPVHVHGGSDTSEIISGIAWDPMPGSNDASTIDRTRSGPNDTSTDVAWNVDQTLVFCDTLSCYSDGEPIGDGSFLLLDTHDGGMGRLTPNGDVINVEVDDLDLDDDHTKINW